jgi:hypothetical protein
VQLLATFDQTPSTITVSHSGLSGLANNLESSMKKFAIAFLAVAFAVAVGCGPAPSSKPVEVKKDETKTPTTPEKK